MSDDVECGRRFSWIVASFPCPSCETKLTGGGSCIPPNHLHTRGLDLFSGTAPASHTCMIPLECLVTSLSQRSICPGSFFICHVGTPRSSVWFLRNEVCLVEVGNKANSQFSKANITSKGLSI